MNEISDVCPTNQWSAEAFHSWQKRAISFTVSNRELLAKSIGAQVDTSAVEDEVKTGFLWSVIPAGNA